MRDRLNSDQIESYIGGYAAGKLTLEEREELLKAARVNQVLFDSLMDEQTLREAMADPSARVELLRRLRDSSQQKAWYRRPWFWSALACAGLVGLALLVYDADDEPAARAAAQQARINVPKPEPVKIPYRAPKKLAPNKPTAPKQTIQAAPPPAPSTLAAPGPLAPAPAPPSAEVLPENADMVAMALDANLPAVEPLRVALEYRDSDGVWQSIPSGEALPAGRLLRLLVTSDSAGVLGLEPALAAPRKIEANVRNIIVLQARQAGTLRLRLSFSSRMPVMLSNPAGPVRAAVGPRPAGRARGDAVAAQLLPPRPATASAKPVVLLRDLQLRFETQQ